MLLRERMTCDSGSGLAAARKVKFARSQRRFKSGHDIYNHFITYYNNFITYHSLLRTIENCASDSSRHVARYKIFWLIDWVRITVNIWSISRNFEILLPTFSRTNGSPQAVCRYNGRNAREDSVDDDEVVWCRTSDGEAKYRCRSDELHRLCKTQVHGSHKLLPMWDRCVRVEWKHSIQNTRVTSAVSTARSETVCGPVWYT